MGWRWSRVTHSFRNDVGGMVDLLFEIAVGVIPCVPGTRVFANPLTRAFGPNPYLPFLRSNGVTYVERIDLGLWRYWDKLQPDWEGYYW